jgi:coenzyme PQQ synthesis protein D (PqqD)
MTPPPGRGDNRPLRSPAVAWQTIDGETVLLRMHEQELLGLNAVGRRVWEMADGSNTIDQMTAAVTAEFRVTAEAARADILRFLDELLALGAVTVSHD